VALCLTLPDTGPCLQTGIPNASPPTAAQAASSSMHGSVRQTRQFVADAAWRYTCLTASHLSTQASQGVAWPPLNILQLLLAWMPRRARRRLPHASCLKLWLPPLDGYSSASGPPRATAPLLTGPAELSYTLFLVTLYPVIAVCGVLLILLHIPAGMVTLHGRVISYG
jgi:hypothetical protein